MWEAGVDGVWPESHPECSFNLRKISLLFFFFPWVVATIRRETAFNTYAECNCYLILTILSSQLYNPDFKTTKFFDFAIWKIITERLFAWMERLFSCV